MIDVEKLRALIQAAEDELLAWQLVAQLDERGPVDFQHIGNFNDFVWNNRNAILAFAEREKRLREITRKGLLHSIKGYTDV